MNRSRQLQTPVERDQNPGLMLYRPSGNDLYPSPMPGNHPMATPGPTFEPSPLPEAWNPPQLASSNQHLTSQHQLDAPGYQTPSSSSSSQKRRGPTPPPGWSGAAVGTDIKSWAGIKTLLGFGFAGKEAAADHGRRKRPCGLAPATFWAVIAVLTLIVIGGIAGAVAGALASRSNNNNNNAGSDPGSGDGAGTAAGPLHGSRIAALSWKDTAGADRRAVFYQSDNALFVTRRDPNTSAWSRFNISSQFDDSPLAVRNATPIAVDATPVGLANVNVDFSIALYFIDAAGYVRELLTTDSENMATWAKGALWDVNRGAADNSDLSVAGYYCDDPSCIQQRVVAYQAPGGSLFAINGTDWKADPVYIVSADSGAPLGMLPFPYVNGTSVQSRAPLDVLRMFYLRTTTVDSWAFNQGVRNAWSFQAGPPFVDINYDLPRSHFAAGPSHSNSWALILNVRPEGDVRASAFMNAKGAWVSDYNNKATTLRQSDGKYVNMLDGGVSSIAMNKNFNVYTVDSNGTQITEWAWSQANPFSFEETAVISAL